MFARDILLDQYYFETIFPRIPKSISDEIGQHLRDLGLPTKALGNAGQGGPDRRGIDDGMRRPASVKASLSVALGQRAPNRAGAREEGRGLGIDRSRRDHLVDREYRGRGRKGDRDDHYEFSDGDADFRSRRRSRSPSNDRKERYTRDSRIYDNSRSSYREGDRYERRYGRGRYDDSDRRRERSGHRDRSRSPDVPEERRRDVADVFREKPIPIRQASNIQKFY